MSADPGQPVTGAWWAGAYWGPRAEPIEACTARTGAWLAAMAGIDPLLDGWCEKSRRRNAEVLPMDLTEEALAARLTAGQKRRDDDGSVIEELGFALAAWNGDKHDGVSLSIRCGATSSATGTANAVTLDLPPWSPRSAGLYTVDAAVALVTALVDAWGPDWAVVTSYEIFQAVGGDGGMRPGRVTWLSAASADGAAEGPFRVEPFAGGTLVVATAEGSPDPGDVRTLAQRLS